MAPVVEFGGWELSAAKVDRRKARVRREVRIVMRPLKGGSSASASTPATAPGSTPAPPKKSKFSKIFKRDKPVANPESLTDAIVEFTERKSKHWAVVIAENVDGPGGKQYGQRLFEICGRPANDGEPDGETPEHDRQPGGDPEEDELDDRYDDDEDYPEENTLGKTMWMKVSSDVEAEFAEPNFGEGGGVFWDLIDRLRSQTKFTNTEIKNEAQRIWNRQRNYRMFNNNCHRFCILLAIHIRSRQESTLRILHGDILKVQGNESQLTTPVENPMPSRPKE